MNRKKFIQHTTLFTAGTVILPLLSCKGEPKEAMEAAIETVPYRTNWAGNYTYQAPILKTPASVDELIQEIKNVDKLKALGSKHCFNNIADSPETQISTEKLKAVIRIDKENMTVTCESGIRYGDLAPVLEKEDLAVHNLASLPHISVAGACATATHGSGVTNGNLSSAVRALELVTPSGEVKNLSAEDDEFYGAVVNLGALGIVSRITLAVEPSFQVQQEVFQELPFDSAITNFDAIMSGGYSVSLFTDWLDKKVSQVWVKRKVEEGMEDLGENYFGAKAAEQDLHPITELSAEPCTPQMAVPGPWYERLPHFKMGFTPSSGDELQTEYFIAREQAVEAFKVLESFGEQINPLLFITEIRSIAADQFWLSPAYNRDIISFHFTWKPMDKEVRALLPTLEKALEPFGVVPHWGKIFHMDRQTLMHRYERWSDFAALVQQYDPDHKLQNDYLVRNFYG